MFTRSKSFTSRSAVQAAGARKARGALTLKMVYQGQCMMHPQHENGSGTMKGLNLLLLLLLLCVTSHAKTYTNGFPLNG